MKTKPRITKIAAFGCFLTSAVIEVPSAAWGQGSMFGTQGPVSQVGSNATGSRVGSQSTLGGGLATTGGALGGTATMSGSMLGQGLGGASPYSTNTLASQLGSTNSGFIGQGNAQGRFIGGGQRTGQGQTGNVGTNRQFQGIGQGFQASQFGNRAAQGGRGTNMAFGANQFGQFGASQQTRTVIRPRQEIAFSYPQRSPEVISRELSTRFERVSTSQQRAFAGVTVSMQDQRTVVLTGTVASEEERALAAIMAGLEPGVTSVQNDLVVRSANR